MIRREVHFFTLGGRRRLNWLKYCPDCRIAASPCRCFFRFMIEKQGTRQNEQKGMGK